MRQVGVEELRSIQVDILSNVDRFCRENGIRYSLIGGSLLGAVRHGGYIPWDDDIDIVMPRPDYDRFLRCYESETETVVDLSSLDSYREIFAKVSRKGTLMVDDLVGRDGFGINIDVFPVDGLPESSPEEFFLHISGMQEKVAEVCPFYKSVVRNRAVWKMKYLLKRALHPAAESSLEMKARINGLLRANGFDGAGKAAVFCGRYGLREIMDAAIFAECEDIPFEGRLFRALVRRDEYLSNVFGDYMQLPPEEDRVLPHQYKSFVL